jgi:hypothetical protein
MPGSLPADNVCSTIVAIDRIHGESESVIINQHRCIVGRAPWPWY